MQPSPHSILEAPLLVEKMMEKMMKIVEKIVEKIVKKIQFLLRWRKSLILCIKSSKIFSFILFQRSKFDFCIFDPFTKVATSFRQFTPKTQN